MQYLTLKRLMSWGPCYPEAAILEMSGGRKRIKIDNIFKLDIGDADKIWILLHGPIFTARELRLMAGEFGAAREAAWRAGDMAWTEAGNAARAAARAAAWKAQLKIVKKYWERKDEISNT